VETGHTWASRPFTRDHHALRRLIDVHQHAGRGRAGAGQKRERGEQHNGKAAHGVKPREPAIFARSHGLAQQSCDFLVKATAGGLAPLRIATKKWLAEATETAGVPV
jgi:hypothetical protein